MEQFWGQFRRILSVCVISGVQAEIGFPLRISFSNLSLSSKKRLCHIKTFALLKKISPYTYCINQNVSDAIYQAIEVKLVLPERRMSQLSNAGLNTWMALLVTQIWFESRNLFVELCISRRAIFTIKFVNNISLFPFVCGVFA